MCKTLTMRIKLLLLISFISITLSSHGQDKASYAVDNIGTELVKKAHVVVRKDETSVILHAADRYTSSHQQVVTIMNKKGDDFASFVQYYKEGSSKIKNIDIKYYDSKGVLVRKIKSKEIEDNAAYDGMSLISDGRLKIFEYQPTNYPVTVEKTWSEESSNTLSLPTWWPINGNNISVESSYYEVVNKTDIPLRTGERNLPDYPVKKIGKVSYELNNQPVIYRESYSPTKYDRYPMVFVAPERFNYEGYAGRYKSWTEFGDWIYKSLLSDKADLKPASAKLELDPILKGVTDKREIIRKIYDYVQENTRYILIGLDEGGLVPLSAQKVHDVKYGDCKALSFYMKSLLDVYGIESNYVIVRAGSDLPEDIFEEYPHVAPANHVIINAPLEHDTIWLDCTSNDNPFNFLGEFTDDRLALQVNESGGTLVRTPSYDKEDNKTIRKVDVHLSANGDITADLNIDEHGLNINKVMYLNKLDAKDLEDYMSNSLFEKFDKIDVSAHKLSLDEEAVKTSEHYSFTASKYGELAGNYMILSSAFLPFSIPRLKKDSNRENDISFPRAYQYKSEVSYYLPVGFHWKIPEPVSIDGPFGSYQQSVIVDEQGVYKSTRSFALNKGTYSPDRYKEIKHFFDRIRKAEMIKYSISNKS